MEGPFSIARAIPKFDDIGRMFIEKQPKILQYGNILLLIGMNGRIEDMMCQMDRISDNDDSSNIHDLDCLVNPTSDSE